MKLIIGIDDHDSPIGGCTTHFSVILMKFLKKIPKLHITDLPYLIRLNPNIPWKTRGNGAVAVKIETERDPKEILDIVWNLSIDYVENFSKGFRFNRKPGVAILHDSLKDEIKHLYIKALSDVIVKSYIDLIIKKYNILTKGDRGIIGSIAAAAFNGYITYELLAYRRIENIGRPRRIFIDVVKKIDEETFPQTFANIDYIKNKVIISPKGHDPVLFGIRGTNPYILLDILKKYKISEEDIDFFMIFKTNQATDSHFIKTGEKPYHNFVGEVTVKNIKVIQGGDVIIETYEGFKILVFKETGELNSAAKELVSGDKIVVYGAVKPSSEYEKIIEIERFEIKFLNKILSYKNPKCPICNSSTESVGKGKGFICKKCGFKFYGEKISIEHPRNLSLGIYQSRIYRHLTKPVFVTPVLDLENTNILNEII